MSRSTFDPADPPPTLEEQYELASGTSDLGLPRGEGAGAQGILAAAAWTESRMGTALMRLRRQWEQARPHKRVPRPVALLRAAGMSKEDAKRQHNREKVTFAVAFYGAKKALQRRIPEYQHVVDQLTVHAVRIGLVEDADTTAAAVVDRWLDDPRGTPAADGERALWAHLEGCLSRARAGLKLGIRGRTNNHPDGKAA